MERSGGLALYEIKASQTAKPKHADNLLLFEKNALGTGCTRTVVYDGPCKMEMNGTLFINRREMAW